MDSKIKFVGILAICLVIVVGVIFLVSNNPVNPIINNRTSNPVIAGESLNKFNSSEDLNNFLKNNMDSYSGYNYGGIAPRAVMQENAVADVATKSAGSSTGASSFSTTNIQVEGVDESDIVKNDGKYIYTVSGDKVTITEAYPADSMKIIKEIEVNSSIGSIYINKDKLIIFTQQYNYMPYAGKEIAMPVCLGCNQGTYESTVYVYDLTDKENPILEKNISVEGNYRDSRMIGDYVYVISQKYINIENPEPPIYYMDGVQKSVMASDVYYFPYRDSGFVFTSILAINVNEDISNIKTYLTGNSENVFVSQDNIYLTGIKTLRYEDYQNRLLEEVYLKILPNKEADKVQTVLDTPMSIYEKSSEIQNIVYSYSNSLRGQEKEDFDSRLEEETQNFSFNIAKESEKTIIQKINVNEDNINFVATGEVPGRVLNQFSMDEYDSKFRIATTTGETWQGTSLNHLYVLDENMKTIGSVEDLAQGERIYSARFMEDRAYIVTFKNVDPLFVIDLSSPKNPKVLGYLKIPGYSDYMQIYDKDHVIGIGKDVNESIDADKVHSQGSVYYTAILGLKVSLFDVSDVSNPKELQKIIIGDRGTDSEALTDHKAVLFDKDKNLLVIPVSLVENSTNYYSSSWQGAYVLNINLDGISVRGRISHYNYSSVKYGPAKDEPIGATRVDTQGNVWTKVGIDTVNNNDGLWATNASGYEHSKWGDMLIDEQPGGINYHPYYYDYNSAIKRSLYIDNTLYTISNSKIKANDLSSLDEIKAIDLPVADNYYGPYYAANMGGAVGVGVE